MFTLNYKKKGFLTNKQSKLLLGTDSESSRRDWVFAMQLSRKFQSKMRDSNLYVTELKKQSILSITLERQQEEVRQSLVTDRKTLLETMK